MATEKDDSEEPTREDQTEGQHRVDEPELFMGKETEAGRENCIRFSVIVTLVYDWLLPGHMAAHVTTNKSPVYHKCPENSCQQNFISFEGEEAPVKKEREMRADDDRKPLSEVPVPGVGAVEIGHAVQDVKLQEVELNQGPLTKTKESSTYI